jgi:hypothetical protein
MEKGIIAESPSLYSHAKNTASIPADPQNSPIILASSQGYVVPPHSRARRNIIEVGAKSRKPGMSSVEMVDMIVGFIVDLTMRSGI